ncbi:hypothetical protein BaRGS_00005996 [Batillaria attramentaria]|uniref:Uncharacterized protein n=1 Tax=Batillaria attramentaria TaxID=370345 RepID=A0ABD0LU36_9CAEN
MALDGGAVTLNAASLPATRLVTHRLADRRRVVTPPGIGAHNSSHSQALLCVCRSQQGSQNKLSVNKSNANVKKKKCSGKANNVTANYTGDCISSIRVVYFLQF